MMRSKLIYICMTIFLFISIIPMWAENITLITDDFWNSELEAGDDNPLEKFKNNIAEIIPVFSKQKINIDGEKIEIIVVKADAGSEDLLESIKATEKLKGIIIVSPLFAVFACEIATEFENLHFMVPCAVKPAHCNLLNISYFEFNYTDAGFLAGKWAAQQTEKVQAIFFSGNGNYTQRTEAFKDGWSSVKALKELEITEFNSSEKSNFDIFDKFVSEVTANNAIAVIFAGPENYSVLNRFDGSGSRLVSENLKRWPNAGFNSTASIELNAYEIMSQLVNSINAGIYKQGTDLKAEFFLYD